MYIVLNFEVNKSEVKLYRNVNKLGLDRKGHKYNYEG